jgi:multidrug efflux system membrane fusion protein
MTPGNVPGNRPSGKRLPRVLFLLGGAAALFLTPLLSLTSCRGRGKAQGPPAGAPVSVTKATLEDVPLQITAIGNVEALSTVQVTALVTGQMVAASFKEGQDVRQGDILFTIDPRPFEYALRQAEANLAKDRASLKNAEDNVNRYTELAEKDFTTQENFEQLKANAQVLQAVVKADEAAVDNARLQLEHCTIRSPIDGRTGSLVVHPGNIVTANATTPLVVLNQVSPIYVSFSVPEQSLPEIKAYQAKGPLVTEAAATGAEASARGALSFIDNAVNTATGTIMLKATFPNTDRALWPGQYVNVTLNLTLEKGRVVVPSRSVQTGQSGQFVMVVRSNQTVEMRPVEVERTYEQSAVIRSGLQAGETVVTDGFLRLAGGSRVEIVKSGGGKT